jgi:hypothetical protein
MARGDRGLRDVRPASLFKVGECLEPKAPMEWENEQRCLDSSTRLGSAQLSPAQRGDGTRTRAAAGGKGEAKTKKKRTDETIQEI